MTLAELGIAVHEQGRPEQRVPCPQCGKGGRDDALGVNIETGVYHCFRCGWRGRVCGATEAPRALRVASPEQAAQLAERKRERLRRTWSESVALDHPDAEPVRRYLAVRGLTTVLEQPPAALRAHPALEYFDGRERIGAYPAMVALFSGPDGSPATLHATFLRPDGSGKLEVRAPKKLLPVPVRGATNGGAIRLYPPEQGVLGVAEGIETALSLRLLQGVPVWAAYCADALERVRVPPTARTLYIAADADERGERAARVLGGRVGGTVYIVRSDHGDLNDELMRGCA